MRSALIIAYAVAATQAVAILNGLDAKDLDNKHNILEAEAQPTGNLEPAFYGKRETEAKPKQPWGPVPKKREVLDAEAAESFQPAGKPPFKRDELINPDWKHETESKSESPVVPPQVLEETA